MKSSATIDDIEIAERPPIISPWEIRFNKSNRIQAVYWINEFSEVINLMVTDDITPQPINITPNLFYRALKLSDKLDWYYAAIRDQSSTSYTKDHVLHIALFTDYSCNMLNGKMTCHCFAELKGNIYEFIRYKFGQNPYLAYPKGST